MSTCTAGGGCGKAAATRRILSGHHPWSSATATAAAAAAAVAAAAAAAAAVAVPVDPSGFARMAAPAGMPFAKCDDAKIIAGGADGLGAGGTGLALAACAAECLTNTACDHFVHYGDNGCKLYDGCTLIQTPAAWGVSSTVYKKMTTADPPTCACKYGVCPAGYQMNMVAVDWWNEYGSRRRYPYPKGHYFPHNCPCSLHHCPENHYMSNGNWCKPCEEGKIADAPTLRGKPLWKTKCYTERDRQFFSSWVFGGPKLSSLFKTIAGELTSKQSTHWDDDDDNYDFDDDQHGDNDDDGDASFRRRKKDQSREDNYECKEYYENTLVCLDGSSFTWYDDARVSKYSGL